MRASTQKIAPSSATCIQRSSHFDGTNATALSKVVTAVSGPTKQIITSNLIGLGPYSGMAPGEKPAVGASVALLDMIFAVAGLAAVSNQMAVSLDVGLPGVVSGILPRYGTEAINASGRDDLRGRDRQLADKVTAFCTRKRDLEGQWQK